MLFNIIVLIILSVTMIFCALDLLSATDIFIGNTTAKILSANCVSKIIRDDIIMYTCTMSVLYEVARHQYHRDIVVIGHTLYLPNKTVNIQYDPNNPFDIRIKQTTYKQMADAIIISVIIIFILTIIKFIYNLSKEISNIII
jgi:hypothetical protein